MLENFQRNWHRFSNLLPIKPENSVPNGLMVLSRKTPSPMVFRPYRKLSAQLASVFKLANHKAGKLRPK